MSDTSPISLCVILDTCSDPIIKVVVSYLRKQSKKGKVGPRWLTFFDRWLRKLVNSSCRAIYLILLPMTIVDSKRYVGHRFGHWLGRILISVA